MALNAHYRDEPDSARDPALDRLYAESAREEPPATLDDAIRAAARREVRAGPRPLGTALRTWRTPVAIAAVLVLSASLVMLMREEGVDRFDYAPPPEAPPPGVEARRDAPLPQAAPAPRAAPLEPHQGNRTAPPNREPERRERVAKPAGDDRSWPAESALLREEPVPPGMAEERRAGALTAPAAPRAEKQENAAVAKDADSGSSTAARARAPERGGPASSEALQDKSLRQDSAVARSTEPMSPGYREQTAKPPAVAAPPPKPLAAQRPQSHPAPLPPEPGTGAMASRTPIWAGFERQPPERWLERIEELRRAGREAERREMLEEFKRRFPDHPVPPSVTP